MSLARRNGSGFHVVPELYRVLRRHYLRIERVLQWCGTPSFPPPLAGEGKKALGVDS